LPCDATELVKFRKRIGKKEVDGTKICISGTPLKRDTKYQKEQKRKRFRRRVNIEPIIGHLKADYRLSRDYLRNKKI